MIINEVTINKKKSFINLLLIGAVFFFSFLLFYNYINHAAASDFPAHINNSLKGENYSIVGLLINISIKATGYRESVAVLGALIVIANIICSIYFINTLSNLLAVKISFEKTVFLSIISLFIAKLYIPSLSPFFYVDHGYITQPWHNITYLLMRQMSVLFLAVYFSIEKEYKNKLSLKKLISFIILLTLTNLSKPNFVVGFAPVMLVVLIYDFFKSRGKTFRNAFLFGLCVLISCVVLIYQYKILYSNGESSIAISISNFLNIVLNSSFIIDIICNYLFPILISIIFLLNISKFSSCEKRIMIESLAMVIISALTFLLFIETGPRSNDGNFKWGILFFSYFIYIICFIYLEKMKQMNIIQKTAYIFANVLYYSYVLCGVCYFVLLFFGNTPWRF